VSSLSDTSDSEGSDASPAWADPDPPRQEPPADPEAPRDAEEPPDPEVPAEESKIRKWVTAAALAFIGDICRSITASFGIWVSILTILIHASAQSSFGPDAYVQFAYLWMPKMSAFQSIFNVLCIAAYVWCLIPPTREDLNVFVQPFTFILRFVCAAMSIRYCVDFRDKTAYLHDPAYREFDSTCFSSIWAEGMDSRLWPLPLASASAVEWTSGLMVSLILLQFAALVTFGIAIRPRNRRTIAVLIVGAFSASWLALPIYLTAVRSSFSAVTNPFYVAPSIGLLFLAWIIGLARFVGVVTSTRLWIFFNDFSYLWGGILFAGVIGGGLTNYFATCPNSSLEKTPRKWPDECPGIFVSTVAATLRGFGIYEIVQASIFMVPMAASACCGFWCPLLLGTCASMAAAQVENEAN
jgi:hypothetical protein